MVKIHIRRLCFTAHSSKYSNNCSSGCVIPIQFLVNDLSQKINITAINLRYNKGTPALTVSTNKIYDVTTTWPKINVSNQLVNFAFLNVTADISEHIVEYDMNPGYLKWNIECEDKNDKKGRHK